jgi:hypothetical protein
MTSNVSRSRLLARWRLLTALLTALGLLAELREPSVWTAAIVPSLVVIMMLVLVVHAQRLFDTLPVVREASEPTIGPLGFACQDEHTNGLRCAGEAACDCFDSATSPIPACQTIRQPKT